MASWPRLLQPYQNADIGRGVFEILVTAIPFAVLWIVMAVALHYGQYWLCALLLLPAAIFLVRLFMIQHDCGHGSFFPVKAANDWVGRALSVLTTLALL